MDKSQAQQLEQLVDLYGKQQNAPPLSNMLEISLILKMQDENAARIIVSCINKYLAAAINRSKGLGLLDKLILQCPLPLVMDNAVSWTNICVNSSSKEPINMLRFAVLEKIMQACSGAPDFNKSVMPLLSKIIDMCLAVNPNTFLSEGSLQCLKICLQKYPSTCGPFKNKIETYLIMYATCSQPLAIIRRAGSAFHYLQQVGGSGPGGITHKNNWSNQLTKLCSTMHKLYNRFFARVTEFESKDMDAEPFEFPQLTTDECNSRLPYLTANTLKNIVVFINCMLVEHFPVEKSISILDVLDVIKRGLLVDTYMEFGNSIEETQFAALLCTHQIDLLYLLRSLIACFKQNVMPFSFTITKLLTDSLQRTQKDYFRSSSDYQKAVYKVLNYWIIIAENKLSNPIHNKLVSLILSEIAPSKSNVTLCLTENSTPNKKKAMKKAVQERIKTNDNLVKGTQKALEIKEITCAEALKTGKVLLQHVMLKLDKKTFKTLFTTVTQQLLNIQGGKLVHPYSNPKCQAYLYEMLLPLVLQPTYCVAPLLQVAANIFGRGQTRAVNSHNDQIFSTCAEGVSILEKLCQTTCPTLHMNQFLQDADSVGQRNRKRMYEEVGLEHSNDDENLENPVVNPSAEMAQTGYSDSPKRIHVLDDRIIKLANESFTSIKEDVGDTSSVDVEVDSTDETQNLDEEEAQNLDAKSEADDKNVETKYMCIEQSNFVQSNVQLESDVLEIKTCKNESNSEEMPADINIDGGDINYVKNINDVDVDELDMLNSFKDIRSQ